jgi:hypothetical protein
VATRKAITAGMRFNHWTVVELTKRPGSQRWHVVADCDCGLRRIVELTSLTRGTTKSCGCAKHLAVYVLPGMKRCSKCREILPVADFYPARDKGPNALKPSCKECTNGIRKEARATVPLEEREAALETARQWKRDNPDRVTEKQAAWNAANTDKVAGYARKSSKKWRAANRELGNARSLASQAKKPDYYRAATAAWAKANPHKCRASFKRYMARKAQAYPAWGNEFFIEEAYELAQLRSKMTGFIWHVDHQVPLQSRLVCGLHVHDNLQVIPGSLNVSKGNRHWPDMP